MGKGTGEENREYKCITCRACMNVCPKHAIDLDWQDDGTEFVEKMADYAAEGVHGSLLPDHHAAGEEKFTRLWPGTNPKLQLEAAEEMNVGRREYTLVEI